MTPTEMIIQEKLNFLRSMKETADVYKVKKLDEEFEVRLAQDSVRLDFEAES